MNNELKTIEHIPGEKRPGNGIWWLGWALVLLGWIGTWYSFGFDWHQIALGGFTGLVLAAWASEMTGNKAPRWMLKAFRR